MIPFWIIAGKKLKKGLNTKQVPLLAIGAAFSFIIMMFNIPIMGGSTGHAIGGTLIAIMLGPWAAVIAISVALVIQALFFGDGGITSIAANCFNMGVVLPFVGYAIYKLLSRKAPAQSNRHWIAAGIGSYVGINMGALCTAIEFGLQPIIYPANSLGQYPYFMYPLSIAVPAMMIEHLILFGVIEAIATLLVVKYLQRTDPALLRLPVEVTTSKEMPTEAHA